MLQIFLFTFIVVESWQNSRAAGVFKQIHRLHEIRCSTLIIYPTDFFLQKFQYLIHNVSRVD